MPRERKLNDEEREQRRAQDRERPKEAAEQLLTREGWQRWAPHSPPLRRRRRSVLSPMSSRGGPPPGVCLQKQLRSAAMAAPSSQGEPPTYAIREA
jgi:hypothetical protein